MKLTLRVKVLAVLLLCSLSAIVIVALVTPWLMNQRFMAQSRAVNFPRFTNLIERYEHLPGALPWGSRDAALDLYRRIIVVDEAERTRHMRALESGGALQRRRPAFVPPQGRPRPPGARQPPDVGNPFASQAMRFVLADTNGYVFHPFYGYKAGQRLGWLERLRADRLYLNGEPVGYALATGTVPQTGIDRHYRSLLYQSLAIAGAAALVISILAALLLTRPMLRQLRLLSSAVGRMKPGGEAQEVDVQGQDEIAMLAHAFNHMSSDLAEKYRALQTSNATIAEQARSLKKLSYTDELTGLSNRRYFNEQFDHWHQVCQRETRELALILIDVDHFKKINDGFSHQIGDAVLQQISHLLRECVRNQDILARFGGEEIILLMPDTSIEKAEEVSHRMRRHIEEHLWKQVSIGLRVTASFGVTDLRTSQHEMLKAADDQLYRAKDAGRNCVCVA